MISERVRRPIFEILLRPQRYTSEKQLEILKKFTEILINLTYEDSFPAREGPQICDFIHNFLLR
jgi:hypothetical protein